METLLNPAEAAAPAAQRRNVSPRPASQFPLRQVGRPIGTLETIRRPLAAFDAAPAGGNPRLTAPLRLSVGDWLQQPSPSVSAGGGTSQPHTTSSRGICLRVQILLFDPSRAFPMIALELSPSSRPIGPSEARLRNTGRIKNMRSVI